MKTRVQFLLAGTLLVAAAFRPVPAEAVCRIVPTTGVESEEACEQLCYSGDCYGYFFDGDACYCSAYLTSSVREGGAALLPWDSFVAEEKAIQDAHKGGVCSSRARVGEVAPGV
jgi:hypothetical protein